jgi:hypothetical protein
VGEGSGIWVPPGGSADQPRREPEPPEQGRITPDELVEQLRRLKIADLLLSTMSTVAQLAYAKLEPGTRELDQARLAIEALRALVPVVEGSVPEEALRDFRQVIANLQVAYASAVAEPAADP